MSGWEERITLRATYVRSRNGDLCTVSNGEVRILANRTRDWSRVLVDLGVGYEEDLDRVLRILEESAEAFAEDPALAPYLLEPSAVLGVASLGTSAVQVRVAVKTQPGKQWEVGRLRAGGYFAAVSTPGGVAASLRRRGGSGRQRMKGQSANHVPSGADLDRQRGAARRWVWQNWSDCTTVGILLGLVVLAVVLVVLPIIWPFQRQVGDNGEDNRPS